MRTINVGDEVVMIEYWLNETGVLAPEQTSLDSRLYGVCLSDYTYNSIIAGPEMGEAGHIFQKWSNSKTDTDGLKEGDSLAFHLEDAAEYFPLLPIEEIRTPSEEEIVAMEKQVVIEEPELAGPHRYNMPDRNV